jgi:amino acid transporter
MSDNDTQEIISVVERKFKQNNRVTLLIVALGLVVAAIGLSPNIIVTIGLFDVSVSSICLLLLAIAILIYLWVKRDKKKEERKK